ncbi:MAG TPA: polymorphic toxin-type HINT domain-containing protein [Polyangiaceae bacterium]|nr:polymorphic toxin-type HINT domain-containing protein [Polyangiaceae bacterium]
MASAAAFAKAASAAPSAARSTAGAEAGGDVPPPPGPDEKVLLFDPRDGGWREGPAREAPKGGELVHAGRLLRVSRALGAAQWVREVDVAKLGDADATYDPAAPRREPEADDVVRVLGEAGRHTALGRVEPGERVAFQGRVYETRAGPGGGLEVRDSGLRVNRVTRTYRRHGPTLVDLTVRYGDGREGVLTGTPEHPFYVPARGGYVPMGELAPGVALQTTDGAEATVAARSERPADVEVHNLEVEHAHNYFVSPPGSGGPGVLVHNATYGSGGGPKPNAKPGSAGGPRAKMPFTRRGREIVREENRAAHGGKLTCEHCGRNDLVEPGQTRGGQPRLQNEAQVDHIIPESKGGDGAPSNGQVLCLTCNGLKKDKM